LGYSLFGIEGLSGQESIAAAYEVLNRLAPVIQSPQREGCVHIAMEGIPESIIETEKATGLSLKFGNFK
jgi:hypothetical protein